ncbi:MAG: NYN domain-containing protein [Bacteroidetes bacterium]|nr:NYN domain-containing protein [Bacteroidota bacterium]
MIKQYLIDGNNLIGKMPELWELQKKDKQSSREKLAYKVDNYFISKSPNAKIFFDGYGAESIPTSKIRLQYCDKRTADDDIKTEIMRSNNPKLLAVISSDYSVMQFAQKSSCKVIKSEDFARQLAGSKKSKTESDAIKSIKNDDIKKLFGV